MRPKSKLFIACILFLTIFIFACAQRNAPINEPAQNNEVSPATYSSIPNPEIKTHNTLSIVMPSDWKEIAMGLTLTYLPKDSEAADPLSEKVVVVVSFKSIEEAKVSLKQMAENGINGASQMLPDLKLVSMDETTLVGLEAIRFTYTATIQGKLVEYNQISAKKGLTVYGIMHSCIKDTCKYTDIYNDMVSSFKALDYTPPKE